jgi:hypothetical protein
MASRQSRQLAWRWSEEISEGDKDRAGESRRQRLSSGQGAVELMGKQRGSASGQWGDEHKAVENILRQPVAAGKWRWENDKWARRKLFIFHEFRNDRKMHKFAN